MPPQAEAQVYGKAFVAAPGAPALFLKSNTFIVQAKTLGRKATVTHKHDLNLRHLVLKVHREFVEVTKYD